MSARVAVVTGAASGIGRGYAGRLAADGLTVAVLDRDDAADTLAEVKQAGGDGIGVRVDLTDPASVAAAAEEVAERVGAPSIVVNNAGIYPNKPFEELTFADWRAIFDVNVDALFHVTQAFLPAMRAASWGRIVNMSSNSIALAVTGFTHYMATKMAVIGFTRGLATEVAEHGITVNAIAPSLTRTPGTEAGPEAFFEIVPQLQAIKRLQQPADLAGSLAFLVSDDAAFVTGQTLYVDGGLVRA
ncbi:SDR family NAD(P)-dependent oxidoreductase [Actinomycetospora flava]|uniref:SDR family NAD(P)-dependent oxidoreductase n=1 Tax=Actinomycetospora flava TaxID=3129232 RepID=A0ABU8MEA0_9PSEU